MKLIDALNRVDKTNEYTNFPLASIAKAVGVSSDTLSTVDAANVNSRLKSYWLRVTTCNGGIKIAALYVDDTLVGYLKTKHRDPKTKVIFLDTCSADRVYALLTTCCKAVGYTTIKPDAEIAEWQQPDALLDLDIYRNNVRVLNYKCHVNSVVCSRDGPAAEVSYEDGTTEVLTQSTIDAITCRLLIVD